MLRLKAWINRDVLKFSMRFIFIICLNFEKKNQVKILNNLNHFNILKFYNWYETRNHLWIIFEYCSGGDLMQLIEQDKFVFFLRFLAFFLNNYFFNKVPENVVKSFGKDLLQGLFYLHSHGIIYCDLK